MIAPWKVPPDQRPSDARLAAYGCLGLVVSILLLAVVFVASVAAVL